MQIINFYQKNRKASRGGEEMSQSTLRHSKWEQESEEREPMVIGEISSLE